MGQLEESGFIEQPTLRLDAFPPTKDIAVIMDHMLDETQLSEKDSRTSTSFGAPDIDSGSGPDRLMERASHALSAFSENVGIVNSIAGRKTV